MLQTVRFNQFDIDFIRKYGNLTEREEYILEQRNRKDYIPTIEEMAEELGISPRQTSRAIETLKDKIIGVLEYYPQRQA